MRLVTARTVSEYGRAHPDVAQALSDWVAIVEAACWISGDHLRKAVGKSARPLSDKRVVFNIKGNHHRIIADIRYASLERGLAGIVKVQFVGTHADYDKVDAQTVTWKGA